jgi:hypothetical protein
MNGGDLLGQLFQGVPGDDEVVKAAGGRIMPDNWVPPIKGAIRNPADWLSRYLIEIKRRPLCFMGGAVALFAHRSKGGEHVEAEVIIPEGADINEADTRWSVWHEIGHAADYVSTREDCLIATPHGLYSTAHVGVLRRYQALIIQWNPHTDRAYKTSPAELWAEVVACAICAPSWMPAEVMAAVKPDLVKLNMPLPEEAAEGEVQQIEGGQQ